MKIAFFDFETTGKDIKTDRVTQLAVCLYDTEDKRLIRSFSDTLYSEEYPSIHPDAAEVTKTTDAWIQRAGSLPYESFMMLLHFFNSADWIAGHNIRQFDLPVLEAELERMHLKMNPIQKCIDTRFDIEYPKTVATRKLQYLAIEHDIVAKGAHSALFDVIMNAELFFKYDINRTLELASSPEIWVRADVSFDNKQQAKDRKYLWDGTQKIWVKQIKEMFYDKEKTEAPFQVLKLQDGYKFPEA